MALIANTAKNINFYFPPVYSRYLRLVSSKMSSSAIETEQKIEIKPEEAENPYIKWRKAKKVAVMISFVGKDYLGMQR